MKQFLSLLACLMMLFCAQVRAEGCLNDDPKRGRYPDGDPRNSTYVRCAPSAGSGQYGSVNAIGQQMPGIMQRRDAEQDPAMQAWKNERDYNWKHGGREQEANRLKALTYVTAHEAQHALSQYQEVKVYPNTNIPPEQRKAIQAEIIALIDAEKLLETFGGSGYEDPKKAWPGSPDPAMNWKTCEVGPQLARSYVYPPGKISRGAVKLLRACPQRASIGVMLVLG
ncbi:MAG: hypothetical protein Q7T25_02555 [Sideroxyarcus sp.]|nr:hypothetical protein [Sideroxyarcus sp.]